MKPVKKTWLIDPDLVRKAQKACGARTETEAVTMALQEMLVRDEIDRAFVKYGPVLGQIQSPFLDEEETPSAK